MKRRTFFGKIVALASGLSVRKVLMESPVAFRFTMRVETGPWENTAVIPFKNTNTQRTKHGN